MNTIHSFPVSNTPNCYTYIHYTNGLTYFIFFEFISGIIMYFYFLLMISNEIYAFPKRCHRASTHITYSQLNKHLRNLNLHQF